MNNFIFENKTKVYFGKGGVKEYLGCLLKKYGKTVMLAYGGGSIKHNGVYDEVTGILNAAGKTVVEFSGIMPNPTYAKVQEGAKLAREKGVDLILAVGGGSVSDCCKIISAQAKLDEDIWDMEMVKHTFPSQFIPLGTIVTVFGTGSEMNAGAVITHEEKKLKSGIFGAQADFAFLDPMYTLSVPFGQVISGAFDTLSHAMEPTSASRTKTTCRMISTKLSCAASSATSACCSNLRKATKLAANWRGHPRWRRTAC